MASLPRGAKPTPRHVLAAAPAHRHDPQVALPTAYLMWPKFSMHPWGNFRYGDCVTAEEAFAKAYKVSVDNNTPIAWASKHGFLNGAYLTEVMDAMQHDGFPIAGHTYDDGPYLAVDWTDPVALAGAVYTHGPVKLGIAADALQSLGVQGGVSGWAIHGYPAGLGEDHCTSLCGFGSLADLVSLFKLHGVTVHVSPSQPYGPSYAMFTWGGIGIVDQQSFLNMTGEAWVRNPPTVVA